MKIRNGFVSNSSSTSFSIVLSRADYEKALALVDQDTFAEIKECGEPQSLKFGNTEVVLVSGEMHDVRRLFGKPYKADSHKSLGEFVGILKSYPHMIIEETR